MSIHNLQLSTIQHANKCHMSTYETVYTLERQTAERLEYVGFYNTSHHDRSLHQHRVIFVERSSTVPTISISGNFSLRYTDIQEHVQMLTYNILQSAQVFGGGGTAAAVDHDPYSDSLVLYMPYVRSSLGKRAFIGPRLWNVLPPYTRNSSYLPIFRSRLKTHLFKIAFPP